MKPVQKTKEEDENNKGATDKKRKTTMTDTTMMSNNSQESRTTTSSQNSKKKNKKRKRREEANNSVKGAKEKDDTHKTTDLNDVNGRHRTARGIKLNQEMSDKTAHGKMMSDVAADPWMRLLSSTFQEAVFCGPECEPKLKNPTLG